MTDITLTVPAQAMADLTLDTPTPRARGRLTVPPMKPAEPEEEA